MDDVGYVRETGKIPISQEGSFLPAVLQEELYQSQADEQNARKRVGGASGKL